MPAKKNMLRQQASALLSRLATLSDKLKLLAAVNYPASKPSKLRALQQMLAS
jgi:hypothetical protein